MTDINEIRGRLNKNTQKRIKMASEIVIEKLPLASLGLTNDLGGGLARGRIYTVWGSKSSAKTSMLVQSAGELQKLGHTIAFVDAEGTYEQDWGERLGLDASNTLYSDAKSIDAMTADVCDLAYAGADFIIVDSVGGLLPSSYYEKNDELKEGLEGTKQIGTLSKEISNALLKINSVNDRSVVVFISQARNKITTYGAMAQAQGGNALMFQSSSVIRLFASASEKEQIKGEKVLGDKILEVPIGRSVRYTIEYSKTSSPGLTGEFDFYYEGEEVGIDQVGEVVDLAIKSGYINKGGAWFSYGDNKFQGRPAVVKWLKSDPAAREEIIQRLRNV